MTPASSASQYGDFEKPTPERGGRRDFPSPALAFPCPIEHCGARPGEACVARLRLKDFCHAPRRQRAEHENAGPQPFDVVYLDGLKYRVASTEPLRVRRGNSHTLHAIYRDELSFDPIAGMWRQKVLA